MVPDPWHDGGATCNGRLSFLFVQETAKIFGTDGPDILKEEQKRYYSFSHIGSLKITHTAPTNLHPVWPLRWSWRTSCYSRDPSFREGWTWWTHSTNSPRSLLARPKNKSGRGKRYGLKYLCTFFATAFIIHLSSPGRIQQCLVPGSIRSTVLLHDLCEDVVGIVQLRTSRKLERHSSLRHGGAHGDSVGEAFAADEIIHLIREVLGHDPDGGNLFGFPVTDGEGNGLPQVARTGSRDGWTRKKTIFLITHMIWEKEKLLTCNGVPERWVRVDEVPLRGCIDPLLETLRRGEV